MVTDRPLDPRTVEQQAQQHAERNRAATRRGLQHARREEHQKPPEPSEKQPEAGSPSGALENFLTPPSPGPRVVGLCGYGRSA